MKLVFVMFDSLNRRSLAPYGGRVVRTPNFTRLAERCVTFDTHFVGSLPCMPARRDMHTGRLSFLHRSWGPLEPFDNSFPELLHGAGVYSHLVSDHYHYWEDGGATYHNRYDTYDFIRGQERDPWKAMVEPPWQRLREKYHPKQFSDRRRNVFAQYILNREAFRDEADFPSAQCFAAGLEFLDTNRAAKNWMLQIETFDPHEPFHAPAQYRADYPTNYSGPVFDWPPYGRVDEAPDESAELRANYCAIVAMCDAHIGKLLDYFDKHKMWDDTALIVATDHGFLLGEHDWWAKNIMPCYNEVARIPLFIHHPDFKSQRGARRANLTQTIDLMPTILDIFGQTPPAEVQGRSLLPMLARDQRIREAGLYGVFGSAINLTDGRYTYFRYPPDLHGGNLYQYTVMPQHMARPFSVEELRDATLAPPFPFTKGVSLLKVPATEKSPIYNSPQGPGGQREARTVLYDMASDPGQMSPISDPALAAKFDALMARRMRECEAPAELFRRFGLPSD